MERKTEQFDSSRFRPMSEGLGLNHFADGLPYTPSHAKKKPMVQFNFPPPRSPKPSASLEEMPPELASLSVEAPVEIGLETEAFPHAGFVRRMVAFGVDVACATSLFAFVVWAGFAINGYEVTQLMTESRGVSMFWPLTLLYAVFVMGYFVIQETTWRCTLGKALFGLRIRASSGFATLGRSICFLIAAVPFGIGLFWYFFDSKRRCWHDVITDCEVIVSH